MTVFSKWPLLFLILLAALVVLTPRVTNMGNAYGDGGSFSVPATLGQPDKIGISADGAGRYMLVLHYRAWQNGAFTFSPFDGCIGRIWLLAEQASEPPAEIFSPAASQCEEFSVDLSARLRDGHNALVVEALSSSSGMGMYAGPQWMGGNKAVSVIVASLFAVMAFMCVSLARRAGLDKVTALMLVPALLYYGLWMYFRSSLAYTNDVYDHIRYAFYMLDYWDHPFDYWGKEHEHPFPFYFLLSRLVILANSLVWISPLTVLHLASLPFYMIFCIYGLRTLHALSLEHRLHYRLAVFMLLFWPLSVNMATRISNDIALYAFWAAALFHITRWMQLREIAAFRAALAFTALAICVKSSGVILLAILAVCMGYAALRQGISFRLLLDKRLIVVYGLLLASLALNIAKPAYFYCCVNDGTLHYSHFGHVRSDDVSLRHFLIFDPYDFIAAPFVNLEAQEYFGNYLLKSALYGEFTWPAPLVLAQALNIALLFLLVSTVFLICRFWRKMQPAERIVLLPHVVCIVLSIIALAALMGMQRYRVTQDFRFIYPMMICMLALWMRGLENTRAQQGIWRIVAWGGAACGAFISVGGIALYCYAYIFSRS